MRLGSLLFNFAGVKVNQSMDAAVKAIASADSKSLGEADLKTREQALDKLGRDLVDAKKAFKDEEALVTRAVQKENERLAAAEDLARQLSEATSDEEKREINASLESVVALVENNRPYIAEHTEARDGAKSFLDDLTTAYEAAGKDLRGARSELESAAREMKQAALSRQQQERRETQTKELAGFTHATGTVSVALQAMKDKAADDRRATEASKLKTELLKPSAPEEEDPRLAAALARASGKEVASTSAVDRLAALRRPAA